jgi:hypothetical protein
MADRPSWVSGFAGQNFRDDYAEFSPGDSDKWLLLITRAYEISPDLSAALQYIRNTGAQLIPSEEYGFKIIPVIGANGWPSIEFYNKERECLVQYGNQVVTLLKSL